MLAKLAEAGERWTFGLDPAAAMRGYEFYRIADAAVPVAAS